VCVCVYVENRSSACIIVSSLRGSTSTYTVRRVQFFFTIQKLLNKIEGEFPKRGKKEERKREKERERERERGVVKVVNELSGHVVGTQKA